MNKYIKLILIAGIIIISDQLTKAMILKNMSLFESIPIIDGFFNLTHLQNTGGAFSFLANHNILIRKVLFLIFPIILVSLLFYYYKSVPASQKFLSFSICLIIGGASGNLIDRFRFGQVTDFLDFYIRNIHFPSFNVADSAISIGMVIFVIQHLFVKSK